MQCEICWEYGEVFDLFGIYRVRLCRQHLDEWLAATEDLEDWNELGRNQVCLDIAIRGSFEQKALELLGVRKILVRSLLRFAQTWVDTKEEEWEGKQIRSRVRFQKLEEDLTHEAGSSCSIGTTNITDSVCQDN